MCGFIIQDILNTIDESWQETMGKPAIQALGRMEDEEYRDAFDDYVEYATSALKKCLQKGDIRKQVETSLHPLLDSIPAKFKLVSLDSTDTCYGLPVLTRSPLALLARHFTRIPLVLSEVRLQLIGSFLI